MQVEGGVVWHLLERHQGAAPLDDLGCFWCAGEGVVWHGPLLETYPVGGPVDSMGVVWVCWWRKEWYGAFWRGTRWVHR